jgi:hypothetical protein
VGAPAQDVPATDAGAAFLFLGAPGGPAATASATLNNPAAEVGAEFGVSVAGLGDVDGDGRSDVVVGARYQDAGGRTDTGSAFVHLGTASGLAAAAAATMVGPNDQNEARFGTSVAGPGDLNADGFDDLVVGAPMYDLSTPAVADVGAVYVYQGSPGGPSPMASRILTDPADQPAAFFGYAVGRCR